MVKQGHSVLGKGSLCRASEMLYEPVRMVRANECEAVVVSESV